MIAGLFFDAQSHLQKVAAHDFFKKICLTVAIGKDRSTFILGLVVNAYRFRNIRRFAIPILSGLCNETQGGESGNPIQKPYRSWYCHSML
jgi:hypothetical protein